MSYKLLLTLLIFLFYCPALSAALPAVGSTPVEEVKPKLKNKDIKTIVVESKVYFLNNPTPATASRIYEVIDSILEEPVLAKKIALAKNPSDNFDLFFSMREALQTVINHQTHLPTNWVNLTTVQKLRHTLIYLLAIYPESANIKDLLSYSPKSIYFKDTDSQTNQSNQQDTSSTEDNTVSDTQKKNDNSN